MPTDLSLPPALRTLLEAGGGLVRRSASGRVGMARAHAVIAADAVPVALAALPPRLAEARETACTPMRLRDVERILGEAWDAAPGSVLDELDPEPLAVTPAAQVHRGARDGAAVAIKVRRPGLASAVRSDLALLDALAAPLRQVFRAMDAGGVLRAARTMALDELDLEHEASTQRRVRRLLRAVDGLVVPAPDLALSAEDVLVTELLDGPTLADGARPADPAAAARALVTAHVRTARAGLVLTDARPGHVVVLGDGRIGLLGTGVAQPVDGERVGIALEALAALRGGDQDLFAAIVAEHLELLPLDAALKAYALAVAVAGDALAGPAALDGPALAEVGERALAHLGGGLELAAVATPAAGDLAVGRSLGQLAAVLSRLGIAEDWPALVLAAE
ncbi:MAG TPA: AarF/UbiB family protein [Baekduia sp.]|nr:AarF/UbiB family protein [Baekduia sp.]